MKIPRAIRAYQKATAQAANRYHHTVAMRLRHPESATDRHGTPWGVIEANAWADYQRRQYAANLAYRKATAKQSEKERSNEP